MSPPDTEHKEPEKCWPRCEYMEVKKEIDFGYALFHVRKCLKCGLEKHDWTPVYVPQKVER
jgi:hypothetical protein